MASEAERKREGVNEEWAGELVQMFDGPEVAALVLMGSFARGDAGPFSDVDLVRFVHGSAGADTQTLFLDGQLVVASTVTPERVERWFTEPREAVEVIRGLRTAKTLVDRDGFFAEVQARAHAFTWDEQMQTKANVWASAELVGLIEEVHKGLNGLATNDRGRMLNARFGLSWLLSGVVKIQRGILLSGDNGIYPDLIDSLGVDSKWVRLRQTAWGIEDDSGVAPRLRQQVIAGLWLYVETARLVAGALQPEDAPKIHATVQLIHHTLGQASSIDSPG